MAKRPPRYKKKGKGNEEGQRERVPENENRRFYPRGEKRKITIHRGETEYHSK